MLEILDADLVVVIVWIRRIRDWLSNRNILSKVVGVGWTKARKRVDELADACAGDVVSLCIELWQWTVGVVWCRTEVIRLATWAGRTYLCWPASFGSCGTHRRSSRLALLCRNASENLTFLSFGFAGCRINVHLDGELS